MIKLDDKQLKSIIKQKEVLGISYRKQSIILGVNEKTLSRNIKNFKREKTE